jgi:PadR family transcriptional regulator PadR
LAYEHLHASLTKGNLWLYVLAVLDEKPSSSPKNIKQSVQERFGFAPATITFYSVLYKLRREELVKRASEEFRSEYQITAKGREQLARAREFLDDIGKRL